MAENRWLQLSFTLGLAVGLLRITRAVLFLAFVRYQQHHRQKVFNWDRAVLFLAFVRYQQHHRQKVFNWDTTFVQGD